MLDIIGLLCLIMREGFVKPSVKNTSLIERCISDSNTHTHTLVDLLAFCLSFSVCVFDVVMLKEL